MPRIGLILGQSFRVAFRLNLSAQFNQRSVPPEPAQPRPELSLNSAVIDTLEALAIYLQSQNPVKFHSSQK
jgi:hypothetical protein